MSDKIKAKVNYTTDLLRAIPTEDIKILTNYMILEVFEEAKNHEGIEKTVISQHKPTGRDIIAVCIWVKEEQSLEVALDLAR